MKYEVLPHEGHDYIHAGQKLQQGEVVELEDAIADIHKAVLRPVESAQSEIINLNEAVKAKLQTLPHIGEARSQLIIDFRPWESVDDVPEVLGLSDAEWDDIKEGVEV